MKGQPASKYVIRYSILYYYISVQVQAQPLDIINNQDRLQLFFHSSGSISLILSDEGIVHSGQIARIGCAVNFKVGTLKV